jgi:hypothetical protein
MDRVQRAYYRVVYPLRERPALVRGPARFEVIECSESGLRYARTADEVLPKVGDVIDGVVHFGSREEVHVSGIVARLDEHSVAVQFRGASISFATILAEQKFLRQHYIRDPGQ